MNFLILACESVSRKYFVVMSHQSSAVPPFVLKCVTCLQKRELVTSWATVSFSVRLQLQFSHLDEKVAPVKHNCDLGSARPQALRVRRWQVERSGKVTLYRRHTTYGDYCRPEWVRQVVPGGDKVILRRWRGGGFWKWQSWIVMQFGVESNCSTEQKILHTAVRHFVLSTGQWGEWSCNVCLCNPPNEEHTRVWSSVSFKTGLHSAAECFRTIFWLRPYATSQKVADSRPDEVNEFFSIYLILPAALGAGVYSASNRNEYQKQTNNVSGE
jgi:hypothetical protein